MELKLRFDARRFMSGQCSSYTEAVKMTSPSSSPAQTVSPKSQVSPASPPENNQGSYVTSTGTLEPSAPYPTLAYMTDK
ncbi:unnamed protein product [Hymenolepis diminuta]|uniref:Netrin receptor DCC n=1 Tax=Hymenolepis diminuta TaxID=6216 RepID=A0A0R3SKT5_HYMDI|nr:unnamed protein product [Hymenolepis diminuta]